MSTTKVTGMMQTSTKGGDISSASPTVIDTDGDYFDVTGTTNFAAFTVVAGRRFTVQFDGILTMTHHATNLDLPGAANITTAAGDVAEFFATGANTVQCVNYTKADGTAVVVAASGFTLATEQATTSGTGVTFGSIPTGTKIIIVSFIGVSTDSGANLYVKLGDAGGLESSGYLSTASRLETSVAISTNNATAAFCINNSATGHTIHGSMTLTLEDSSGFTWASTHSTFLLTTMSSSGGGTKSLSAELTQVQVLPASGNFDAGAVNIAYL